MRKGFLPGRLIFLCGIALAIAGCSVQRPDAALEYSGSNGGKHAAGAAASRAVSPRKEPVRVNYLALLSQVTNPQIYIYKEKRRLYVVQSGVVVRDYPLTLGIHPVGDKRGAQDGRTPEGDFYICAKTPWNQLQKALIIDYPDKAHAQRALSFGLISPLQFQKILLAAEWKTPPPWDTKLGGAVSIHADNGQDSGTHGDIELYDSDMRELYKVASLGTPVYIRP